MIVHNFIIQKFEKFKNIEQKIFQKNNQLQIELKQIIKNKIEIEFEIQRINLTNNKIRRKSILNSQKKNKKKTKNDKR